MHFLTLYKGLKRSIKTCYVVYILTEAVLIKGETNRNINLTCLFLKNSDIDFVVIRNLSPRGLISNQGAPCCWIVHQRHTAFRYIKQRCECVLTTESISQGVNFKEMRSVFSGPVALIRRSDLYMSSLIHKNINNTLVVRIAFPTLFNSGISIA